MINLTETETSANKSTQNLCIFISDWLQDTSHLEKRSKITKKNKKKKQGANCAFCLFVRFPFVKVLFSMSPYLFCFKTFANHYTCANNLYV